MAKEKSRFVAGDYDMNLLNYLGVDFLRSCVKESDLAVETAQKCREDVRNKALATVGVLSTFIVALFVALYTITAPNGIALYSIVLMMAVFGYGVVRLFFGIIFEQKNYNGGATLSSLLHQDVLDGLADATKDEKERLQLHLFYQVGAKETAFNNINKVTKDMQDCYKSAMTTVVSLSSSVIIAYLVLCALCQA